MKKIFLIASLFALLTTSVIKAQDKTWGFNLTGFVKTDIFYDSRQVSNAREGHFLYFPLGESLDKNGTDVNAKGSSNILSIQTRLNGKITGPDAFGAKTSAMIEGEFFGTSDADVNGFRLRHAIITFDWKKTSLMAGQYWHPMFVTDVYPGTISFNTGAPFQPFSRNPQLRLTQGLDDKNSVKLMLTAYSERDFQSSGPAGTSSVYLRNAMLPGLDMQLQYKSDKVVLGAGGDFKMLKPRLITTKNVSTDETISSFSGEGYAKFKFDDLTIKLEGVYGQNMTDMSMLGGYALKTLDTSSGVETYSPISTFSVWGDISYGKDVEFGIFGGYTKNLGATDNLFSNTATFYYSRGYNIDNVFRVSPRISFTSGKAKISAELETTSAAYGTVNKDNNGKVEATKSFINVRGLLAFYYFF
jgi:hypothetical protein